MLLRSASSTPIYQDRKANDVKVNTILNKWEYKWCNDLKVKHVNCFLNTDRWRISIKIQVLFFLFCFFAQAGDNIHYLCWTWHHCCPGAECIMGRIISCCQRQHLCRKYVIRLLFVSSSWDVDRLWKLPIQTLFHCFEALVCCTLTQPLLQGTNIHPSIISLWKHVT